MKLINKVLQVGIVVKNIDEYIGKYKDVYGINEWEITTTKEANIVDQYHFGVQDEFNSKVALAKIGEVEIELIEPMDATSCYAKFLKENGEGLHHLAIDENKGLFEKTMKEKNIEMICTGFWPGFGRFRYYDTRKELGFISEIYDFSENI